MAESKIKNTSRKDERFYRWVGYAAAFIIPAIVGIIVFMQKGIAPFGTKSLLCMDLWGQYMPMYVQNATSNSLSDFFHSWNGGFGYNNFAQNAYYCNSVLWLILRFVPVEHMVATVDWICLFRISLSAVTCLVFLNYKLKQRSILNVAAAISYSLCAYMLAFISQCMWIDSLIFAPLILLGIEKLIDEKKPAFYIAMLALSLISSFYIGFALCIFASIYFVCGVICRLDRADVNGKKRIVGTKDAGKSVLRFAVSSLLAGAISAAVIIPTYMAIQNTLASEIAAPTAVKWYKNITDYFRLMLPDQPLKLEFDGCNLFTGISLFLLLPLYFCNKKIRAVERITSGCVLVFLFLSMNLNLLDYMWHGFHFPNQLPGRWTFIFSLYTVMLAVTAILRYEGLNLARGLVGTAIGTVFFILAIINWGKKDTEFVVSSKTIVIFVLIAALSLAICYFSSKRSGLIAGLNSESVEYDAENDSDETYAKKIQIAKYKSVCTVCAVALAAVQILDVGSNFVFVSNREEHGLKTSDLVGYSTTIKNISEAGNAYKCKDNEFYRTEAVSGFTFNPSMLGDYKGIGYYSSTMQGSVYNLLKYMGNRVYAQNVSTVYTNTSTVQNSLFGIKNYMDSSGVFQYALPCAELVSGNKIGNCTLVKNTTALPIAYGVSDDIANLKVSDEVRAIQNQNNLLNLMYGENIDVFEKMDTDSFSYDNATLSESANWNYNIFTRKSAGTEVKFHYTYTCKNDGFIYLESNFRTGKIKVNCPAKSVEIDSGSEKFRCLGKFNKGDKIIIEAAPGSNYATGYCGLNLYGFNESKWQTAYSKFSSSGMKVTSFKNTSVEGTVNMEQDGTLFTSIAQDGGWEVYCDGKKVETQKIGDALVGVKLKAGSHNLKFKYNVPGLKIGIFISVVALILAVIYCKKLHPLAVLSGIARKDKTE